jgi:hypothetical protein
MKHVLKQALFVFILVNISGVYESLLRYGILYIWDFIIKRFSSWDSFFGLNLDISVFISIAIFTFIIPGATFLYRKTIDYFNLRKSAFIISVILYLFFSIWIFPDENLIPEYSIWTLLSIKIISVIIVILTNIYDDNFNFRFKRNVE